MSPRPDIEPFLVTAEQMQQIEARIFAAGMPVAALMEKVAGRLSQWFAQRHGKARGKKIGVLAGPGHNGGDALVMARELHYLGYELCVYQPFAKCKPLTAQHAQYAKSLGIAFVESVQGLIACDAIIDGGFGFGLTREITHPLAGDIEAINQQPIPVFSIDLPSGIHTDSGQVLGVAIRAKHTACLGLWKRGLMQASALAYLGKCELIDFDIPLADIAAVLGTTPAVQRLTRQVALAHLPLNRAPSTHKYQVGHLLLIAGSKQYAGAALLAGQGAIASGVGMLTLAVPESIRLAILAALPGALLMGCPETADGAIAQLPSRIDLDQYDAIALGPGLTPSVPDLLLQVLNADCPVLLDADGLNLLAQQHPLQILPSRSAPTILTPHTGEFKRLFPDIHHQYVQDLAGESALAAAQASGAIILLKGPRSAIATPNSLWFNPDSTPALARGGSGDVLTGLMGGLGAIAASSQPTPHPLAQTCSKTLADSVLSAVWWHSQAALYASHHRSVLGVDPLHLAQALNPALQHVLNT
ncbi:MAG: NAD(P)H-hydrate dehydratase [Phormidesmis sp. RL_2_1]|nr:NAD(P)H-hydrate dehydratase [Phormidesmis sp. RL_2_1]